VVSAASNRTAYMTKGPKQSLSFADVVAEIRGRRLVYTVIALAILVAASLYAYLSRPVFRSEATIAIESGSGPTQSGSLALGGLASLAGLSFGAGSRVAEIIATLKARGTALNFISRENIAGVLLHARWDPNRKIWVLSSGSHPVNAAYAYEVWNRQVLHISEDQRTNLVTVDVDWYNPHVAAEWNADFLKFTDSQLREDALQEAEASITYLNSQLSQTRDFEVRRSIADLLEQQLKSETLAKVRAWYALRVIDPPAVPIRKYKPSRALIIVLGLILSGAVVFLVALAVCLLAPGRYSTSFEQYADRAAYHGD
jgi:uncharacterized protein involved in exopolysaccharide biosynthesis